MAHRSVSGLLHTVVGNSAMNPAEYWQCRYEPCAIMPLAMLAPVNTLAALQRELGNLVQLLKKPTQVPPISMDE